MSDHKYIRFLLSIPRHNVILVRPLKSADWTLFNQELELPWDEQPTHWDNHTIEAETKYLYDRITSALDKACPKKTITECHRLTWWTSELDLSRKRVRRAHHLAITKGGQNWAEYNLMRREHKYAVKNAKANSWREFTSNTNNTSTMAKLSKIIHHQQNKNCIGLLKYPNSPGQTQNINETLQVLMSEHFPDSTQITQTPTPPSNPTPPPQTIRPGLMKISFTKL